MWVVTLQAQENRRRTDFDFDLWDEDVTSAAGANAVNANEWLGEGTKVNLDTFILLGTNTINPFCI